RAARPPSRSPLPRWSTAPSCDELLERRGNRFVIAERHNSVADNLAGFMALAGNQQNIAAPQFGDGRADGFAPVADFSGAARCRQDRGADGGGVLAARIVVGN